MEGGRTFPLARRVGHVVGIDSRREHLQRGRFIEREFGVANVTFLESDLEAGDLAALGTFDAIFNVGLLYHLHDPARLLKQCAEVAPEMLLWTHVVDDSDSRKHKIDCNAVYRLMDHGLWWPLLENKRLAIVSGHADAFAARLMDTEFVRSTGGGEITWTIATRLTCPPVHEPKHHHLPRMRDQLFAANWDLMLCSAGSLSAILCEQARSHGHKALDIGAVDSRFVTL